MRYPLWLKGLPIETPIFWMETREYRPDGNANISYEGWFPPDFVPAYRSFAEAAKALFTLRDRYLLEIPNLWMALHPYIAPGVAVGALYLPFASGHVIALAFRQYPITPRLFGYFQTLPDSYSEITLDAKGRI